jgi:hypothetical protein
MLEIWTPFEPFSGSSLNHRDLEFELSDNRVRPAKKKWLAASSVTLVGLVQAGRQAVSLCYCQYISRANESSVLR